MKDLSQADWKAKLEENNNAIIIDVRSPQEWQEGIIPNAIKIDIMDPQPFIREIEKLDKDIPYFIYCRSGGRSGQACSVMNQKGFKETYNLLGGMLEWEGEIQ
jgi:rhodanese-related sulfurtransferase